MNTLLVRASCLPAFLLFGCGGALPSPLAKYPEAVHIVELDAAMKAPKSPRSFGYPAASTRPNGKFVRDLSVGNGDNVRKVAIECSYELSQAACATLKVDCQVVGGGSYSLTLAKNGEISLERPETAKEATLLVEMDEDEMNGNNLRKDATGSLALPSSGEGPDRFGFQLAEAERGDGSDWLADRTIVSDFKFNLLLATSGGAYVSIHQLHPSYERTFAILATAGTLYADNRATFESCTP